ncbi:hypothetical protein M3Y97_01042100 [Aphelenchoides bicaudatus]|nr:hypothetical protein M3Y97_01042100 [Aphelenchoides bicaudatus]
MDAETKAMIFVLFALLALIRVDAKTGDACGYCRYMVETFKNGLMKTESQHFAGGNTDWEERKLGKFKTSETRFVEIMEHVCKKFDSDDSSKWDSLKNLQFKCSNLAEETEELLEMWFFRRQESDPDIFKYICIDNLQKCCPDGHHGPNCSPCPGALVGPACFGNGKCIGDGTREGSGSCECNEGYAGVRCSNCDAHYFSTNKNDTFIECKACFDGCATGCKDETPTGCLACRTGYKKDEEKGCIDINECESGPNPCQKANEECKNTQGHYSCECLDGFRRNFDTDDCELDIQEPPPANNSEDEGKTVEERLDNILSEMRANSYPKDEDDNESAYSHADEL